MALFRMIVSVILRVPGPMTATPAPGRFAIRLFSIVSEDAPDIVIPSAAPDDGSGTMTRLRSATLRAAAGMLMAHPPVETTLPTAPGMARIDTDFVM